MRVRPSTASAALPKPVPAYHRPCRSDNTLLMPATTKAQSVASETDSDSSGKSEQSDGTKSDKSGNNIDMKAISEGIFSIYVKIHILNIYSHN